MLNQAQEQAASHVYGPMMVVAGPGSGKTRVLTERIKRLLSYTSAERICVITFARKAAEEMKERFALISGSEAAERVSFGTFHSLFYRWLREWDLIRPGTTVLEEEEFNTWMNTVSPERELRTPFLCHRDEDPEIQKLYREYKEQRHAIDFEDMVRMMDHAIPFFEPYKEYDFFLVDEFQDIDPMQYRILKRMVCKEGEEDRANLFVVGDEDQSIYAFRGSDPGLFLGFEKDFPGCARVDLSINYRCDPKIVSISRRLIMHNISRFDKELIPGKEKSGIKAIYLHSYFDEQEEGRGMAKMVRMDWALGRGSIAILCRTQAEVTRLCLCLEEAGVAFEAPKGSRDREDRHIVLLRKDMEKLDRFSNHPDDKSLYTELIELMPNLRNCGHYHRVEKRRSIPEEMLKESLGSRERGELKQFQNILVRWKKASSEREKILLLLMETGYLPEVLRRLEKRRGGLVDLICQVKEHLVKGERKVQVMTMHGSKGLEFDTVYIPSLCQGKMPREEVFEEGKDTVKRIEEERRLMYVALTRAKRRLHLSYFYGLGTEPSQFVYEALEESV